MTNFVKSFEASFYRFWVYLLIATAIAVGMTWLVLNWFANGRPADNWFADGTPPRIEVAAVVFVIWLLTSGGLFGFYLLNRDNHRIKLCAREMHQISHLLRDTVAHTFPFADHPAPLSEDALLLVERETLQSVCIKIAAVFNNLIGRKCVVTVKLLAEEEDRLFCFTWARSDNDVYRAGSTEEKYWVDKSNTALLQALQARVDSPTCFHSADLRRSPPDYRNQRKNWHQVYLSAIVVPIQFQTAGDEGDVIGFLSVDTLSINRLNASYHAEFLAGFADQMYTFLSIMRQTYPSTTDDPAELEDTADESIS